MSDLFNDASSAFVKAEHLIGRLLLVTPLDVDQRASTMRGQEGKMYTYVSTTTVVLDGEPDEMITAVPVVLEDFQFSGAAITPQLKPGLRTGRPTLGRLGQKPSATKGFGAAWILEAPDEDDRALARTWIEANPAPDPFGAAS
jgi:hypothetical protein